MSRPEKEKEKLSLIHERRLARCPHGDDCEVAERQYLLMMELAEFRTEFAEIKTAVNEVVVAFNDAKTVVNFLSKTGTFIRYFALTIAALGTIWAAITHWPKGH